MDVDIVQTTQVLPLAVCPDCVASRPTQAKLPPLDEARWAETLKRKAVADSESKKKKTEKAGLSATEIANFLGL